MSQRPTSLDGLHNVVMARRNQSVCVLIFFQLGHRLGERELDDWADRLAPLLSGFFNEFNADNQSTQREKRTVHLLRSRHDLTQAAPPSPVKARFCDPLNHLMATSHGCLWFTHEDKYGLEDFMKQLEPLVGQLGPYAKAWGARRETNYVHREFQQYLDIYAPTRKNGHNAPLVCLLPVNKTAAWWNGDMLWRKSLLTPLFDETGQMLQRRHFHLGAEHLKSFYRHLLHSMVGYQRENALDFLAGFEMAAEKQAVFMDLLHQLRDTAQNPEWAHVVEGTLYFGQRVATVQALLAQK